MTDVEASKTDVTLTLTRNDLANCISGIREILLGEYHIPTMDELEVLTGSTYEELEATMKKLSKIYDENFHSPE